MTFIPTRATALSLMPAALAAAGRYARRMGQRRKTKASIAARTSVSFDPASPSIEAIYQHAVATSSPIVGIAGVTADAGVSSLVRALARRASAGGQRALLIDSSSTDVGNSVERTPEPTSEGYYHLTLRPAPHELLPLREVARLRKLLRDYIDDLISWSSTWRP